MEQVKVLQIGLSSYPGGVENAIMSYFRHLDKYIHFDFICTEDTLAYSEEIECAGSRIYYLPSPKRHMYRYAKELRSVINNGKYDIVHVNMLSAANIFPVVFSKGTYAKKIIAHAHNASLPGGGPKKAAHHILKYVIPLMTKDWMACSPGAAMWLFGKQHLPQVHILKNAIAYDRFRFDSTKRKQLREEYGVTDETPVIGHVGRFGKEKNHDYLVELFASIKKELPNGKLLLVGTGPLLEETKKLVARKELTDSVIFIGGVTDAAPYYQMMDVFCLPSKFEGLGIVAVEAQAAGLPCICSDGVPQEAIFTSSARRIALDETQLWVDSICDFLRRSRGAAVQSDVDRAGYNIAIEAKNLKDYYLG